MAKSDPEREAHKSWLGLVQPVGLVVSPPALLKAQVILDKNITPVQQALAAVLSRPASIYGDAEPQLLDFPRFATQVLGWSAADLAGALRWALGIASSDLQGRARVSVELATLPPVRCNETRLGQVFINLLQNAAKFGRPRGHIALRTRASDDEVRIEVDDPQDTLRLGMPATVRIDIP